MRRTFIDEAVLNAQKSLLNCSSHGAVVIYRGKIIGNGCNKDSIENINRVNKWTIHAEVDAINNALRKISKENLKQSTLIVVRVMNSGDTAMSAPCKCCEKFIKRCGIKTTYYS